MGNGSASDTATPSGTMRSGGIGAVPSSSCRAVGRHRPPFELLTISKLKYHNPNVRMANCKLRRNDRMTESEGTLFVSVCLCGYQRSDQTVDTARAHSFHWCFDALKNYNLNHPCASI